MVDQSFLACPVCWTIGDLGDGPGGRPRAQCRACRCLERHRGLVCVVPALLPGPGGGAVLEIAPSANFSPRIASMAREAGADYLGIDFDPGADGRAVDVRASLTDLPMRDASVGLLICFHVLEHVPEDGAAMSEIARVLADDGIGVIQVPIRRGVPTDEDPSADEATRVVRFGQADHVRYYGDDFEERLRAQGLHVESALAFDLFSPFECTALGLEPRDPFWFVTTSASLDVERIKRQCSEAARGSIVKSLEHTAYRLTRSSIELNTIRQERDEALRHSEAAEVLDRILRRPEMRARRLLGRVVRSSVRGLRDIFVRPREALDSGEQ